MSPKPKPLAEVLPTLSEDSVKLIEAMIEGARSFFAEQHEVPPAITCLGPQSDSPQVYSACHRNDTEKACVWAFLRFLRETHPIVLMISEVWLSVATGKDWDPAKHPRPSQDPNRQEKVMISLWEIDRNVLIAADLTRNPDKLGEFLVHMDTQEEGHILKGELSEGEHYKPKGLGGGRYGN